MEKKTPRVLNTRAEAEAFSAEKREQKPPLRLTIEALEERLAPSVGWGCNPPKL
jgi:hypothetical protein